MCRRGLGNAEAIARGIRPATLYDKMDALTRVTPYFNAGLWRLPKNIGPGLLEPDKISV